MITISLSFSLKIIEGNIKLKERALKTLYKNSTSDYNQLLNKSSMKVKRLRNFALEMFRNLNQMNPEHMKENFHKTANLTHGLLDIKVYQNNTAGIP